MKVFLAVPGITGHRSIIEADTKKRIDGMFYNTPQGPTPIAYCYKLENAKEVTEAFDTMNLEEKQMKDRHYKKLMELRSLYGI